MIARDCVARRNDRGFDDVGRLSKSESHSDAGGPRNAGTVAIHADRHGDPRLSAGDRTVRAEVFQGPLSGRRGPGRHAARAEDRRQDLSFIVD